MQEDIIAQLGRLGAHGPLGSQERGPSARDVIGHAEVEERLSAHYRAAHRECDAIVEAHAQWFDLVGNECDECRTPHTFAAFDEFAQVMIAMKRGATVARRMGFAGDELALRAYAVAVEELSRARQQHRIYRDEAAAAIAAGRKREAELQAALNRLQAMYQDELDLKPRTVEMDIKPRTSPEGETP